jgi:hypothetical protein
MDDLSSMISQLLGSEEGMNQLRSLASSLGLAGTSAATVPPASAGAPNPAAGAPDLSAISSLLSGLSGGTNQSAGTAAPDLSGLSALLSGLTNTASAQPSSKQTPDLSGLSQLLSGLSGGGSASGGGLPNLNMNTLMGLQKAFSELRFDPNVELLRALKPHFSPERQKKVDDAVRILQLIKLLPLIKDSGLFGGDLW